MKCAVVKKFQFVLSDCRCFLVLERYRFRLHIPWRPLSAVRTHRVYFLWYIMYRNRTKKDEMKEKSNQSWKCCIWCYTLNTYIYWWIIHVFVLFICNFGTKGLFWKLETRELFSHSTNINFINFLYLIHQCITCCSMSYHFLSTWNSRVKLAASMYTRALLTVIFAGKLLETWIMTLPISQKVDFIHKTKPGVIFARVVVFGWNEASCSVANDAIRTEEECKNCSILLETINFIW